MTEEKKVEAEDEEKKVEPTPIVDLPYDFDQCTISISIVLLPDDEGEGGRPVVMTVQNHRDAPIVMYVRHDKLRLPDEIITALDTLKEDLPNRKLLHIKEKERKAKEKKKSSSYKKKEEPKPKTKTEKDGTEVVVETSKDGKVVAGQIGMKL